jgi:hypothetical protein
VRGRLEATAAHGLTPFVGRDDELRLLMNRWERALEGEGHGYSNLDRGKQRRIAKAKR